MNSVSHKKGWNSGTNPAHVEPLPNTLIKETYNGNSDKDYVKLKLRRYPKSSTLDLYEFKVSFFYHGYLEDFLVFKRNFNITTAMTGMLYLGAMIQYLHTLVHG